MHDVQRAELGPAELDCSGDVFLYGHVAAYEDRCVAVLHNRLHDFVAAVGVAPYRDHRGTLGRHGVRHGQSETTRGSGDDSSLAGEASSAGTVGTQLGSPIISRYLRSAARIPGSCDGEFGPGT